MMLKDKIPLVEQNYMNTAKILTALMLETNATTLTQSTVVTAPNGKTYDVKTIVKELKETQR